MPVFNDYDSLFKFLRNEIKEAMSEDMAKDMIEIVRKHVEEDVYQTYQPEDYVRTYGLLKDVVSEMIDDETLQIRDDRHEGEKDITKIIETGFGYTWGYERDLAEDIGARPFMENAMEEIDLDKLHVKSLKRALRKRGLDVI